VQSWVFTVMFNMESYLASWLKVLRDDKKPFPRLPVCPGSVGFLLPH
jgi:hypothetical protein